VAAKTIRYYEQIGLLPAPSRTASGYRQYDPPGVERLRFIGRARSLGLPLQRLKTLTSTLNGAKRSPLRPRLLALVREQLSAVQHQIDDLELLRQQLERVSRRMLASARGRHTGPCRCLGTANVLARQQREARPHRRSLKRARDVASG
jgi:DNA-binding transcriptional MerR regulator